MEFPVARLWFDSHMDTLQSHLCLLLLDENVGWELAMQENCGREASWRFVVCRSFRQQPTP